MDIIPEDTILALENNTSVLDSDIDEDIDMDHLIEAIRKMYIRDFYGEHFHLIFEVCFAFCVIGYLTNILNIIVFRRMSLCNSMNLFLLILSVSDIAFISTQFAHVLNYFSGFTTYPWYSHYLFLTICTFLESIFLNISNWMLAIVGIWRYVVITWPQRCSRWFTQVRVKIVIAVVFVFSVLLALPMFLFFTYDTIEFRGLVLYDYTSTEFANSNYRLPLKIYWGFLLLRGLVPMIIMINATGGLIWSLCKSQQSADEGTTSYRLNVQITIMLVVLLVMFLLSNLPDSFMFLITVVSGGDSELQAKYREETDIIKVFMLANNTFSFFVYIGLGYEFRRTFTNTFFPCCKEESKSTSVTESVIGNAEMKNPDKNIGVYPMETVDFKIIDIK